MERENLCKTCKFGLVLISVGPGKDEVDGYQFCNVMETPIKFTSGKITVECNRYLKKK